MKLSELKLKEGLDPAVEQWIKRYVRASNHHYTADPEDFILDMQPGGEYHDRLNEFWMEIVNRTGHDELDIPFDFPDMYGVTLKGWHVNDFNQLPKVDVFVTEYCLLGSGLTAYLQGLGGTTKIELFDCAEPLPLDDVLEIVFDDANLDVEYSYENAAGRVTFRKVRGATPGVNIMHDGPKGWDEEKFKDPFEAQDWVIQQHWYATAFKS